MKSINLKDFKCDTLIGTIPDPKDPRRFLARCTICNRQRAYRRDSLRVHSARCSCRDRRVRHNASGTNLYSLWQSVKSRVKIQPYRYPLALQKEWAGKHSYPTFRDDILSTIGKRPSSDFSLDRIRVLEGYVKGNLRWATDVEQANNRTSNNLIECPEYGAALTAHEWARFIVEQTERTEFTRAWFLEVYSVIPNVERIISAYHPHRCSPDELQERTKFADDFDAANAALAEKLWPDTEWVADEVAVKPEPV